MNSTALAHSAPPVPVRQRKPPVKRAKAAAKAPAKPAVKKPRRKAAR